MARRDDILKCDLRGRPAAPRVRHEGPRQRGEGRIDVFGMLVRAGHLRDVPPAQETARGVLQRPR